MYELIDSGDGNKLERFGDYSIVRPCAQAVWKPKLRDWKSDATFSRIEGWEGKLPSEWRIEVDGLKFRLSPTDFGHIGLFPEHREVAEWVQLPGQRVLNLFAYSGGVTLAAAKAGAEVCHVDASKGMVEWARENAALNNLEARWIVDDAMKFCAREVRRGKTYDAIVLDPPTYGRGPKGEVFKIEEQINPMLDLCRQLKPSLVILSCHTPGWTPLILDQLMWKGKKTYGELLLDGKVPSGSYVRWEHD